MSDVNDWMPLFPESEIPKILRITHRCGSALRKKHSQEHENDLSLRLCSLIVRDSEYRNDLAAQLELEVPLYLLETDKPEQLGRVDLKFTHGCGRRKPYPYFAIEAKRLHVRFKDGWKSLVTEYVTGHQGMMCFITGRYSRGLKAGAMVGYVFDSDLSRARLGLDESIRANASALKLVGTVGMSKSPGNDGSSETRHDLRQGDFCLYHLLLSV